MPPLPSYCKKFYVTEELSFPLVFSYLKNKLRCPQLELCCLWSPCVTALPTHIPEVLCWLLLCGVDSKGRIWHLMHQ